MNVIKSRKELEKDLFDVEGYDSKRRQYEEILERKKKKKKRQQSNSKTDSIIKFGEYDKESNVLSVGSKKRSRRKEDDGAMQDGSDDDEDDNEEEEDEEDNMSMDEHMNEYEEDGEVMEEEDVDMETSNEGDKLPGRTNAKTAVVNKDDDLEYDLFHLMAFDKHPINKKRYEANKQDYILKLARDNMQLLVAKIFSQKTFSTEDGLFINMPRPVTQVPREKHVPKPKLPTKWEQFKKQKGLITRKKEKLVFDEATQEWRSSFGWKRANDDKGEWIVPAKDTDELGSDPFIEKRRDKKKAMELQKKNEIANKRRQENFDNKIPGSVYMSHSKGLDAKNFKNRDKAIVEKSFEFAKFSTASMGKFDKKLKSEPRKTDIKHARKEKFGTGQFSSMEKDSQRQVLNRVLKVSAAKRKQISEKGTAVYQKVSEKGRRKQKKSMLAKGERPHKMRKTKR